MSRLRGHRGADLRVALMVVVLVLIPLGVFRLGCLEDLGVSFSFLFSFIQPRLDVPSPSPFSVYPYRDSFIKLLIPIKKKMIECDAIHSMCNIKLEDVTPSLLLKWFYSFTLANNCRFE